MSSVCPSVRLSVCKTLMDCDHIGWNLTARTIRPTPFALHSPKAIHLLPGKHGEILRRLEVGWEKVVCWSTKAAVSLKRVKIEEKLLRNYRNSPTLFRTVPSPTPYGRTFPKVGGSQPQAKTSIVIISGMGKAIRTSSLAGTFTGSIPTKAL